MGGQVGGKTDVAGAVQVANLALKHRRNKHGGKRIVVFVGSPIEDDVKTLIKVAVIHTGSHFHTFFILVLSYLYPFSYCIFTLVSTFILVSIFILFYVHTCIHSFKFQPLCMYVFRATHVFVSFHKFSFILSFVDYSKLPGPAP